MPTELLADGDATLSDLAEPHHITIQAVTQHLQVPDAAAREPEAALAR